jgi:AAA family ATP:ADP antiporter
VDVPVWRVVVFGLLAFGALGSYGLARPAVESIFLGSYGATALPYVWLVVAVVAMAVVGFYNRYAATVHPARLFGVAALISALVLVGLLVVRHAGVPGSDFVLYVWKDVYIVVLVEIFWTYANKVFPIDRARWLYGGFLLAGAAGSVVSELGVGWIAERWGTTYALWAVVPLLLCLAAACIPLLRALSEAGVENQRPARPSFRASFSVVRESPYIGLLLALIAVTQVVITLVDYQFNTIVAEHLPNESERTALIGQVYASISGAVIVLNALSGLVLRFVGISRTLMAIPILLGLSLVGASIGPVFAAMVVAKVVSKAFDYSLFRSAKEILYIPLSPIEKTRGKAIVDMLGYRVAKGFASALILGLTAMDVLTAVIGLTIALIGLWVWLTVTLVRNFQVRSSDA